MPLAAGLRSDPLGELTALPQTLYLHLTGRDRAPKNVEGTEKNERT